MLHDEYVARAGDGLANRNLFGDGSTLFCARCGFRATQRVKFLRQPCWGSPPSESTAYVLKRLKQGYLPDDNTWHGRPVPAGPRAQIAVPGQAGVLGNRYEEPVQVDITSAMIEHGMLCETSNGLTTPLAVTFDGC